MIIDCHVHISPPGDQNKENLLKQLDAAGLDQIVLLSYQPASFSRPGIKAHHVWGPPITPAAALTQVMEWAAFSKRIIPFYWIDPLDGDAFDQVDKAVGAGVAGFKVICNRYYPGEERPMQVWEHIAKTGKPILFHAGILYANHPCSKYSRPVEFEDLIEIPNLRFALAHAGWPWCDEFLAVYGCFNSARRRGISTAEMFIDTCPGTPDIYREDVFRKLYTIPYDIENNILFGTDAETDFDPERIKRILKMDNGLMDKIGVSTEKREKYFYKNVQRFLNG